MIPGLDCASCALVAQQRTALIAVDRKSCADNERSVFQRSPEIAATPNGVDVMRL